MLKRLALFLLALTLAACSGAAQTAPQTPLVASGQTQPTPTLKIIIPTAAPAEETGDTPPIPSGCTAAVRQFTPNPDEVSLFPAVSAEDWAQGLDTAAVTIIEYGDFQ